MIELTLHMHEIQSILCIFHTMHITTINMERGPRESVRGLSADERLPVYFVVGVANDVLRRRRYLAKGNQSMVCVKGDKNLVFLSLTGSRSQPTDHIQPYEVIYLASLEKARTVQDTKSQYPAVNLVFGIFVN